SAETQPERRLRGRDSEMAGAARLSAQEILARKRKISGVWGQSPHPRNALVPIVHAVMIYLISTLGTRSPSKIAKRCKAAFQSCTGMVHFLATRSKAR